MIATMEYVRDPEAIYAQSFDEISRVRQLQALPEPVRPLATRVVHACGMPDVLDDLRFSPDVASAARAALDAGSNIYCDVETVKAGIMSRLLPPACALHCRISAPEVAAHAKAFGMTRAAAQMDLWGERLAHQIIVIGNAPTALFRLLELIDGGLPKPALIVAFPVGFVGAAEAKAELAANPRGMPFVTLLGRRGGAGMAQAAINALAGGLNR
ncbi:MAG: precorrin-8X methylmutase [Rhizobiaceae bacterium]|nr:precorrin-8X methylmutase [Rhizobiaceae bacterium]